MLALLVRLVGARHTRHVITLLGLAAACVVAGGALTRAEGDPAGAARLGAVALAVGRVVVLARLAGWDWVAPCG